MDTVALIPKSPTAPHHLAVRGDVTPSTTHTEAPALTVVWEPADVPSAMAAEEAGTRVITVLANTLRGFGLVTEPVWSLRHLATLAGFPGIDPKTSADALLACYRLLYARIPNQAVADRIELEHQCLTAMRHVTSWVFPVNTFELDKQVDHFQKMSKRLHDSVYLELGGGAPLSLAPTHASVVRRIEAVTGFTPPPEGWTREALERMSVHDKTLTLWAAWHRAERIARDLEGWVRAVKGDTLELRAGVAMDCGLYYTPKVPDDCPALSSLLRGASYIFHPGDGTPFEQWGRRKRILLDMFAETGIGRPFVVTATEMVIG